MTTSLSEIVKADLIRDEGWRTRPYRCTAGFLSIGVGHNLDAEGLCAEAIMAQLEFDIRTKAVEPLDRYLPWWAEQPEAVRRALLNLMFNMGPGTLLKFKNTLELIRTGRYREAAAALLRSKYAKQVGKRAERVSGWIASAAESAPSPTGSSSEE